MNAPWIERADGYFFPRSEISEAVESKLQMLALEDAAQISQDGTLLPFDKSVLLAEEDAELLQLPPRNPYQISIRTESYIGKKNFRYVVELLNSDSRPLVNPQINGALLRTDGENFFRLTADQFALINLVKLGNENISREEPLLTVRQIQRQASTAAAKVDKYIADKKIITPDKLDVDFQDSGDVVKVAPVLLENHGGKLERIDSADFQSAFGNRQQIRKVYRGSDGAQYVFSETLRDGLTQIKSVGTLSKADAARYRLQPRELFTGDAFNFNYSDRVIGVEEIKGAYQIQHGVKINWTDEEFSVHLPQPKEPVERRTTFALKIKENFERVDYKTERTPRGEKFFGEVLCPDVKLMRHQISGVWLMSQLWQSGWRGILVADDMGLGKTLQTLTFIGGLKKFGEINSRILIVAPTALLENWQAEYKKFLRGNIFDDVISLHGNGLKKFFTDERTPNHKRKLSLENLPQNSPKTCRQKPPPLGVGRKAALSSFPPKFLIQSPRREVIILLYTLKIRLYPSKEQAEQLLRTMERFNAACNFLSQISFENKIFRKTMLQRFCYYRIRDEFKLSAQMIIRAIAKVCESYSDKNKRDTLHIFKPHGAIVYDDRILTIKSIDTVSILTLDGRIFVPMSVCEYHSSIINNALRVRGQTDLGYVDGKFYLFLVAECVDKPENTSEGFLGVDLGIVKIATTSDGKFYSGTKIKNIRRRYFRLRRKLQAKGTKSAKRLLKRRRRKESRFATDVNHCVSKRLVQVAKGTQRAIVLEDLKGIRERTKKGTRKTVCKTMRQALSSWAFYQLRLFIEYKARAAGVQVIYVDPRNTSRTCSKCGHIDKKSRRDQEHFVCTACGHALNADINAALNIARRGADVIQPNAVA